MNDLASVTTDKMTVSEAPKRASLAHPSHPPQPAWDGPNQLVLFQESAQPVVVPWTWLLAAAVAGAAIVIGVIFGATA